MASLGVTRHLTQLDRRLGIERAPAARLHGLRQAASNGFTQVLLAAG